jgi:hypothetical protein
MTSQTGYQLVQAEVLPLTPELAREFRDLPGSPTERDLNGNRLQHLRRKAEKGQLVTFHWAKAQLEDLWMRVNGQHSSTMLCELNGGFPEGIFVHVDSYRVDDADGLALLFRQLDDRKSGRSAADVAGAYQNLEDELRGRLAKPVGKLGIEAVTWYRRLIDGVQVKIGDEQYHLFHESALHQFLLWLNEIFSIKTPELRRVPVVAAMYGTFEKNEEEARRFWDQVARGGEQFEDSAPSTVLDEWLKTVKEERSSIKPGEYYRGCIYAWNAFRENKQLKDIRCDMRKAAQIISD